MMDTDMYTDMYYNTSVGGQETKLWKVTKGLLEFASSVYK